MPAERPELSDPKGQIECDAIFAKKLLSHTSTIFVLRVDGRFIRFVLEGERSETCKVRFNEGLAGARAEANPEL